jgi:hypothetical protein
MSSRSTPLDNIEANAGSPAPNETSDVNVDAIWRPRFRYTERIGAGLTFGVREYATDLRLTYDYHDDDREPQVEELMLALTDGRRRFPLVVVRKRVLTNPTREELQRVLDDQRMRPEPGRRRRAFAENSTPSSSPRGR